MKKKMKLKNKQKQKQKQKQSVIVNIDNSRKSISKPREKKSASVQQQPSIIPQPIYIPQITYAPPERPPFREEPVRPPVFNPNPPIYNPPPIVPQQVQPTSSLSSISSSYFSSNNSIPSYVSSSNNSIPSYVTFGTIVNDDDSSILTSKPPEQEVRDFNFMDETPSERRKNNFTPKTIPSQTMLTAKKYLDENNTKIKLIYNERDFGNDNSPFAQEEYNIPSALDKEIRPINQETPNNFPSPLNDSSESNLLVNNFGGVAAPLSPDNSKVVKVDELDKAPRMRTVPKSSDRCAAITKNGSQCQNRRQFNSQFCGTHSRYGIPEEFIRRSDRKVYPL